MFNIVVVVVFFFFKQNTSYEIRISDWSSYVCSSDLGTWRAAPGARPGGRSGARPAARAGDSADPACAGPRGRGSAPPASPQGRGGPSRLQTGRVSCRERVWRYGSFSVVADSSKTNNIVR